MVQEGSIDSICICTGNNYGAGGEYWFNMYMYREQLWCRRGVLVQYGYVQGTTMVQEGSIGSIWICTGNYFVVSSEFENLQESVAQFLVHFISLVS